MFALSTYIGCLCLNILLELDYFSVTRRGFFCNDNSIKYPYQEDSISSRMNFVIHSIASITTFIIGEFCSTFSKKKPKNKEGKKDSKSGFGNHLWYIRAIKLVMMCSWCNSITLTLTSIIKTEVGWLRPNFLAVCNPNVTCTANSTQYNVDYECLGTELFEEWKSINITGNGKRAINQSRRSFPSGHASYTASISAFAILYIEERIKASDAFVFLKPFLQLTWVGISVFVAFSRVKDHYHHLQDVIFGMFLGSSVSILAGRFCMKWLINLNNSLDKSYASNKVYPYYVKGNVVKSV